MCERRAILTAATGLLCLLAVAAPGRARGAEHALIFSVKTWEGEYASKDVPGGVETTPAVGAIYTIRPDGSGLRVVVPPGRNADSPMASPDGRWVYYQSNVTGDTRVYRCKRDGTGTADLTPPDRLTERFQATAHFVVRNSYGCALAADGRTMAFTVHDGKTGRVALANADGSSPQLVAPALGYTYMAALSPTGDRVAFSGPARGYRLLTAAVPGGDAVELTPDHTECFVPQFVPDGKSIVFIRRDGDVYRVDADGKNLKRLTVGNGHVEFRLSPADRHGSTDGPDVSPDGTRIACVAIQNGVANVFVTDLDGGNRRQLTFRRSPCGRVRWSPDGQSLAFVSFVGKYPQLFVVPAAGGDARQLTALDGAVSIVNWCRVASPE